MSRVIRKPDFRLSKNKYADQLRSNCPVFATRIVHFILFLYQKFQDSSFHLWVYSQFVSDLFENHIVDFLAIMTRLKLELHLLTKMRRYSYEQQSQEHGESIENSEKLHRIVSYFSPRLCDYCMYNYKF